MWRVGLRKWACCHLEIGWQGAGLEKGDPSKATGVSFLAISAAKAHQAARSAGRVSGYATWSIIITLHQIFFESFYRARYGDRNWQVRISIRFESRRPRFQMCLAHYLCEFKRKKKKVRIKLCVTVAEMLPQDEVDSHTGPWVHLPNSSMLNKTQARIQEGTGTVASGQTLTMGKSSSLLCSPSPVSSEAATFKTQTDHRSTSRLLDCLLILVFLDL